MGILAEVDEDGLEELGYDIRIDCNKGRGVYATKGLLKTAALLIYVPKIWKFENFSLTLKIDIIGTTGKVNQKI